MQEATCFTRMSLSFPVDNVTHASLLRAAGYTTAYVGKWHMDSQRERPGFDHHYTFTGHARSEGYAGSKLAFAVDGRGDRLATVLVL